MKRFTFFLLTFSFSFLSCTTAITYKEEIPCANYRQAMRNFVISISNTAHEQNPSFIVVPQNGQNVAWDNEETSLDSEYIEAIDGCGREDTFYGMDASYNIADGKETPAKFSTEIQNMCDPYVIAGKTVLSIDYTGASKSKITDSFEKNANKGYISFAATQRSLTVIPDYSVYNENTNNITCLSDAKNFLYLINPENYSSKEDFITALSQTNYDLLIIDLFCMNEMLNARDLQRLKQKQNGASRLVICYMSIGEAEDYRWYWENSWKKNPPRFMCTENKEWKGNFKVKYWYPEWQEIIYGDQSYLSKILDANFDGVYLDIIDAFEYFEEHN